MANLLCGTTILYATSKLSLTHLLANLGFAHNDVHIMTDKNHPGNTPTKENIVSTPRMMSLLPLLFIQLRGMRALVQDAQPNDSLFFYCA